MHGVLSVRLAWILVVAAVFSLAGCAEGFAPRGDADEAKFDEDAAPAVVSEASEDGSSPGRTPGPTAIATARPTPMPSPTPTASPTPTPTPSPTPTATPTPTPTPTPMIPPVLTTEELRVTIGESALLVVATDPDSTITDVELLAGPEGTSIDDDLRLRYAPVEAGTFAAEVTVTDSQGLSVTGDIVVVSRYPGHPQALVALGDSVASGHGLDLLDYLGVDLGGDRCWRSDNSYPRRTFDRLVEAGVFPAGRGEFALLACSGYDVDDLWERTVVGGFSDIAPADGRRSQLDWAVRSNPRFVTVTIGANDTGFVGPEQLFLADGETLDREQVARRLGVIERDLEVVLDRLVQATDATIFVTNYYNPTAANPQGIPTCRLDCFRSAADEVVDGMNRVIETVARAQDRERVVFVDVVDHFDGHSAPNGLGPDGQREEGFGALGALVGADQIGDVHPYCARGDFEGESWINPVDCVHPTDRGTEELAALMSAAIVDYVASATDAE